MSGRQFGSWRELAEYLILLGTAALGFAGAPWWSIVGSASALFSLGWDRWNELGVRAKRAGADEAFACVVFMRFGFAGVAAFLLGNYLRGMVDL